jgi:hypothetical protein
LRLTFRRQFLIVMVAAGPLSKPLIVPVKGVDTAFAGMAD